MEKSNESQVPAEPTFDLLKLHELHESPSNPRKAFDDVDLEELAASIKEVGLLQPIVVRPNSKGFEIVCGHRRFRACKIAQKQNIPSIIRTDLTDDQALELQITENLQRKDVHPLEEAVAFERLQKERNYSITEIAARVGKSEKYVVQRMVLNQLIPEIQPVFYAEKLTMHESFLLARHTSADQKMYFESALKNWQDDRFQLYTKVEYSMKRLMHLLDSAPFDREDAELVKAAGPCTSCPKNTACNTLLFPDHAESSQCMDGSCFDMKVNRHLDQRISELSESGEEFYLLYNSYDDSIHKERFRNEGYTLLKNRDDFRTSEAKDAKTGIWISGHELGRTARIQLTGNKLEKIVNKDDPEYQIQAILTRETRAKQLDDEKVYAAVDEKIKAKESPMWSNTADLNKTECAALVCAMIKSIGYPGRELFRQLIGKESSYSHDVHEYDLIFQNLDKGKLNQLMRHFTLKSIDHYKGMSHTSSMNALAIYELSKDYIPKEVAEIEAGQKTIREKRQARVSARVAKLEEDKAQLKSTKKAKAKAKA